MRHSGVEEGRDTKVHRPLCVVREQTGAAKWLRGPLSASVMDVATVPAPPHTRRGPEHALGRVRLRGGGGEGPKSPPTTVCGVWTLETGATKCLRGPLSASALDVSTVPASPHTWRVPEHVLGRVRLRGGGGAGTKSPPTTVCGVWTNGRCKVTYGPSGGFRDGCIDGTRPSTHGGLLGPYEE